VGLELDRFSRPSYRLPPFASLVSADSVREVDEKEALFFTCNGQVSQRDSERPRFDGTLEQKGKILGNDRRTDNLNQVRLGAELIDGNLQQNHGI
jgi:hypothetical protein